MKTLLAGVALAFSTVCAGAADLPMSVPAAPSPVAYGCGMYVPTIWGGLECQGALQYGGGTAAGPGDPGTHAVTVTHNPPPSPPDPPGDDCGPKGEGGKHGHGERGARHGRD